jgi:hypothetical protein
MQELSSLRRRLGGRPNLADYARRTGPLPRLARRGDGVMDGEAIDQALHEIQQMAEVSIRAAGRWEDNGVLVSQIPFADHELLDFSLFDLAQRVKASRAMLFEGNRPVTVKPVLSIVRDQT